MASGSESAAEKVGLSLAVGPTEDVVQALMETLLDPFLPLRVSSISPSENVQIAVAKQMHAVVLLYNYHHRKQKPELVFLEFVDFCKLAIVIRPPLIAFMKLMKGCTLQELNEIEDLLSVTEKAIKDACDIARGLDASRDVPNMEGWPISKVAVVLIDSKKENCMFLENELNESTITAKMSMGNEVGNKRKRDDLKLSTCNTEFLQLGYDAVKDVTGFSFSDLEVLKTHITYSLSKQKSAACFYIMQYPGLFDEHNQVSLKFLVESVQSPLAEKVANGSWKSTALVKLHQMLPYMELIMCWFSWCEPEMKSSEPKASPVDIFQSTEKDADLTNKSVKRFETLDHADSSQNRILENLAYDESLPSSPSRVVSEMAMKEDSLMEFEKGCDMTDHDTGHSAEKDERRICPEILDEDRVECGEDVLSGTRDNKTPNTNIKVYRHRRNKNSSLKNVTPLQEAVPCPEVDMVDALESNIESEKVSGDKDCLTYMCNQTDTASNEDLRAQFQAKTEYNVELQSTSDSFMSNGKRRRDEKESGDEGYLTSMCDQAGTASTKNQLVQLEAVIKHDVEEESAFNSVRPDHNQSIDEKLSGDEGDRSQKCNDTGIAATGNQLAQVEAETKHNVELQSASDSCISNSRRRRDEKESGDKVYLINMCNQAGTASTENQQDQLEDVIKHDLEEESTLKSIRPDHDQSRDAKLSGDEGDRSQKCNDTGIAATGNQLAQVEAETKHNVELQNASDSCISNSKRRRDEKESGDEGYLTNRCNQAGTTSTENQQDQLEAIIKHDLEEESTLKSLRPDHDQIRDAKLSVDEGDHSQKSNHTDVAATNNQLAQVEAETKHNVDEQSALDSLRPDHNQSIDEKLSGDEGDHSQRCNHSGIAATGNQLAHVEAETKHNVDEQSALDSSRMDHNQSRDKKLSADGGDYTQKCNHPCTAATGNQLAHVEAGIEQNVDVESTLNSLRSDHNQSRDEKLSGDKGDQIQEGNHTCIAATGNQQSEVEAEMMPNVKVQSTSNSLSLDYIQSRDEKLSIEKGDHTYKCNHTGIVSTQNQLPQLDAKSKHGVGTNTISASDQQQNALALLYRKRQELYSQICNMEDKLALCEDYVARIRDGGEVALARQCIKSVLSGKFHSLLEKGTQVQNKGNQQDANDKSQLGKPTKLSEAYITGKSSSQDLEYTCLRNNWRLPRYLTESSNGKFLSKVVVEGKEFKLHAKGGLESTPYKARETAAAQMITVMHATFL